MTEVNTELRDHAVGGLRTRPRTLHCKFLYDERGSELFDAITQTEEYYPTRTELEILNSHGTSIADAVGPRANIVEFGSGSGAKTVALLEALEAPRSYTPVEISMSALEASVGRLRGMFSDLLIEPHCADYTRPIDIDLPPERRVVFFPGSTIGNFTREEAVKFLGRAARFVGQGGGLLIGADLKKDPQLLHAAYNDAAGVTAKFTLNLLRRLNREAQANFDLSAWSHYAHYAPQEGRIEIYLVSLAHQVVTIGAHEFPFDKGEAILTEYSHKYNPGEFESLAGEARFELQRFWSDPRDLFGVFYFEAL